MQTEKIPHNEVLFTEMQQITQNFLKYEENILIETSQEFQARLKVILKEIIEEIFLSELSEIEKIKGEISFISQQMKQKNSEFSYEFSSFLREFPNANSTKSSGISEDFTKEIALLREALHRASIEFCEENRRNEMKNSRENRGNSNENSKENSKKTLRKKDDKITNKKQEKSFFKQRPRSANVFFMEKRLKEMQVRKDADLKEFLKPLIEEWKGLNPEEKAKFEEKAEKELLNFI